MKRRQFDPAVREWMDVDQPISAELERDLDNLTTLNRAFGSHALIRRFLKRWLSPGRTWRILDLATGAGDIPRLILRHAQRNNLSVKIDAVDAQPSTLEIARRRSPGTIRYHLGDIRIFGAGTQWDIVLCSLALHHFDEDDAIEILRRATTLATQHVLVSDLRRCTLGTLGVDMLTAVWMREPMTRNDARMSVRRAFSFAEMKALARAAGWREFSHERCFCFRQALWK